MQAGVNGLAVSEAISDSDNLTTTTAQFITLLDTPNRIG
jgi:thiamine monophosphate synthase